MEFYKHIQSVSENVILFLDSLSIRQRHPFYLNVSLISSFVKIICFQISVTLWSTLAKSSSRKKDDKQAPNYGNATDRNTSQRAAE